VKVGPSPYGTTRNADGTYVDTIVAGVTTKPHILVNGDFIGTIEVKYYKEAFPHTEGEEIYSFTLVRGIRKFTDADPLEFKRYLSMPAGTNLFVNPTIPANQDIDLTSVGTGDYTLSGYGSGSVTVAANTATGTGFGTASAGSDVTFNITVAGTITLTVTDTPDIVQVEQNSFATSPVDGVRQTTRLIESTTGEYRANNLCGIIQSIPMGAGQTAWLLHSYVDANNGFGILQEPTQITFRKTASGVDTDCSVSYTHAAGTPVRIGWVQTASGMRIKEQHWTGAAWSSWSSYVEVTTDAGKADLQVADTYEIGSKNGSGVYAGNIQLARPWWSSDPDYLEGV